jgi:hypothetical protein
MSKCITEYIDDWCRDTFGHTNWEFYDHDNKNKYIEIYEDIGIGIFEFGKDEFENGEKIFYTEVVG